MPRRRKAVAPRTDTEVLRDELERLRKEFTAFKQAGPSAIHLDDYTVVPEPIPGQVLINHPGVHTEATEKDPVVYYHPGDVAVGGATPAGFKAIQPSPPVSWIWAEHTGQVIRPAGSDLWNFPQYQNGDAIDADARYLFFNGNKIPCIAGSGCYVVMANPYFAPEVHANNTAHASTATLIFDHNNPEVYPGGAAAGQDPSADWRWLMGDPYGVGVGAGYGPRMTIHRKVAPPSGDLWPTDTNWFGGTRMTDIGMFGFLMVAEIPEGEGIPVQVGIGATWQLDLAGGVTGVDQTFECQISIVRLGDVRGSLAAYI